MMDADGINVRSFGVMKGGCWIQTHLKGAEADHHIFPLSLPRLFPQKKSKIKETFYKQIPNYRFFFYLE